VKLELEPCASTRKAGFPAMSEQFDVIFAGASFGRSAVVGRLRAGVLIIDTYPPCSHQRSSRGTFLSMPATLRLLSTVLRMSDHAVIYAPGVPSYRLDDPSAHSIIGASARASWSRGPPSSSKPASWGPWKVMRRHPRW
jgi:hypothetical protein